MSPPSQPDEPARHVLQWPEQGVKMAFRLIPAGSFRMGSRGNYPGVEPVHEVRIAEPFWLAETPVTQAQFSVWTETDKIMHQNYFLNHPDHPANNMTWHQAAGYCRWLMEVHSGRLPSGDWLACLPTEAEWEYACHAGTVTDFHTGDGEEALAGAGWFGEATNSGSTHPVAKKQANEFGLFDMHGNVWEWCHDVTDETSYRRQVDGDEDPWRSVRAADYAARWEEMLNEEGLRMIRGGSWVYPASDCRSVSRCGGGAGLHLWDIGFRVCLACRSGGSHSSGSDQAEAKPHTGGGDGALRRNPPSDEVCAGRGNRLPPGHRGGHP
jgi:formylglycine-generating enzyme required for sulfatase activity